MDVSPSSPHPSSRSTPDETRVGSSGASAASTSTNIWDSAWAACTQQPPPNLTEVLGAYAQKGDGDREMLLGILKAKSAEDQRIAAVASLHQTILQLQAQAVSGHAAGLAARENGLATPPMPSPLPPPPRSSSIFSQPLTIGRKDPSPPLPSTSQSTTYQPSTSSIFSQSHPQLPPISSMGSSGSYADEQRRRSRVTSSSSRTSPPARPSPEYPLSPYSAGSGRRSPRSSQALPTSMPPLRPAPYPPASHGRLAMAALTHEEDGDAKYRRMSVDRKAR